MSRIIKIPDFDDWVERYNAGMSLNKISKELKMCRWTITEHFRKAGVKLRNQSEAERIRWDEIRGDRQAVIRQCSAAWKASKGRVDTIDSKMMRANTRQIRRLGMGKGEVEIFNAIAQMGFSPVAQYAWNAYNIDIAIPKYGIAVEVFGRSPGSVHDKVVKHIEDLLNGGWTVLMICIFGKHSLNISAVSDNIISFVDLTRRDNTVFGKYGVIGGDGEFIIRCSNKLDHLPRIEGF